MYVIIIIINHAHHAHDECDTRTCMYARTTVQFALFDVSWN